MARTARTEELNTNAAEQEYLASNTDPLGNKVLEVRKKALERAEHIITTIDVPTNETQIQALYVAIEMLREARLPY